MIRKFIVTGAAGHLARALILELMRRGYPVRGLILPGEARYFGEVEYVEGDVTRRETLTPLLDGLDLGEAALIHAAGIVSIANKPTEALRAVNVEGTRNITELCAARGVARMVYVSSVHAIPEPPRGRITREAGSFSPELVRGGYAKSKAEASQIVIDAALAGLNAVIVQPSGIIGPYDLGGNHLTQLILSYMRGRMPFGVRGGYDFVDVRDAAAGCVEAALKGAAGECYILSGEYATIARLFEALRARVGGPKRPCLPVGLAHASVPLIELWARLRRQRPIYTAYSLYTLSGDARFSHEKATRAFGYSPRPLEETIGDTVDWLRLNA